MTEKHRQIIAELEREAREDGLEHHLEAARGLAADGIDIDTIDGMMRWLFSRTQIKALIAEAQQKKVSVALPVIA